MRIKDLFSLKQEQQATLWTYLATYWLAAKDISNFSPKFHYLDNNNRVKATNSRTPFYCNDIIYYIKDENRSILTGKAQIIKIYTNIHMEEQTTP